MNLIGQTQQSGMDMADLYARALAERGAGGSLQVEREGAGLHPTSLSWWLREPGAPEPDDFKALWLIEDGPVLDVGCATGRHLERLGQAGIDAEGIDLNPFAVELARASGARAACADVWRFRPARGYRWVLALGNNIGIAGDLVNLPALLGRFAALLLPDGRVLLSSVVPSEAGQRRASRTSGYPGQMRLRHHYAGRSGPWFQWLYVDPAVLTIHARMAGFGTVVVEHMESTFLAVLTKRDGDRDAQL